MKLGEAHVETYCTAKNNNYYINMPLSSQILKKVDKPIDK